MQVLSNKLQGVHSKTICDFVRKQIIACTTGTGTALQWQMFAGTSPKPYLRSRPDCHIPIMIRPDKNFLTSPNSSPFEIKTQWNGISSMRITSPKVPPSKTILDQLCPLPRSSSCAIIHAFSSKRAPITISSPNWVPQPQMR